MCVSFPGDPGMLEKLGEIGTLFANAGKAGFRILKKLLRANFYLPIKAFSQTYPKTA